MLVKLLKVSCILTQFEGNKNILLSYLDHNLEYGQTKSGQLGDWLVKEKKKLCMQSKKLKKELMLNFKMISRTCFIFMIAFTVYE